ncbi:MAG TPA: serine hydrolase, partial [Tabrizicola sp.]
MTFVVGAIVVTSPLQAAPFAAIVMDGRTGEVLYEKNADARLHPASLTKMMTLYITFQEIEAGRLSLDTKVTVTKYAASQPPSRLGLKPGQKIAVRYLIRAAAIKSANDAASALGDHIGGDVTSFAKRMTRTARQLGMNNTTFKNANGLTADGHLSSARDMNILGRHLFYDFPQYYHIFSRRTADAGVAQVANTNTRFLEAYEGADGIKTGYTVAAGFNLTASAHRGNKHIIATVFGGTSTANRNAKMKELMDLGFGKAPANATELPPVAAAVDDALVASLETGIDEIDAEGGAGKVVRVSGEVKTSPRPKARPGVAAVPEEVVVAMNASIEDALAEATAAPAPEGTLEFQAEAMTTGEAPETALAAADDVAKVSPADDSAPVEPELALAAVEPEVVAPVEPGTLEAQAVALASGAAPTGTELAALPEVEAPLVEADPALAGVKPRSRPAEELAETMVAEAEAPAETPLPAEELVVAAAAPEPEVVVTDPGVEVAVAEEPQPILDEVTEVETVAGAANLPPPEVELAAATVAAPLPKRQAPIFDAVAADEEVPAEDSQEVVVVVST